MCQFLKINFVNKKTIAFFIFLIFFLVYYIGSFSKISFGDCIGFVLEVEKRDFILSATPLSHFLYINTAVFFSKYLNIDSVVVMRLMSVIPGALTVSLVYIFVKEFIKENWIAITGSFVFGLSFTFWRSAETVEVYTFNALFIILFLITSVRAIRSPSFLHIILSGIFLSVSFWVHIQNIMLIPAYIFLLYLLKTHYQKILLSLGCFLTIISLLFFVNHLNNIDLKYTFLSNKGNWVQDTFKQSFSQLLIDVLKSIAYLIYNFNFFIIASISGIIYLYKNENNKSLFLFIAALFTFGFATFYAVTDNYVFFISSYLIITLFIAAGIKALSLKYNLKKLRFIPLFTPLFYILSFYIILSTPSGKKFHQEKLYKDGLRYYMLPWLNNNIGCIEFTLDNVQSNDKVDVLKNQSTEFIKLRKKHQPLEEIRKL